MSTTTIKYNELSESEFLNLVSKGKCLFFKGIQGRYFNKKLGYINTKEFIRPSKEVKDNYHFYDELLNECYSWGNFPKRKHSIIGSTSLEVASLYAMIGSKGSSVYFVIPINAQTVYCPTDDILSSFNNKMAESLMTKDSPSFLLDLNNELKNYFYLNNLTENEIRKINYNDIIHAIENIDISILTDELVILKKLSKMEESKEVVINELLDPKLNNFFDYSGSNLLSTKGKGKEVFASGEVLLCEFDEMTRLGLNPLIK